MSLAKKAAFAIGLPEKGKFREIPVFNKPVKTTFSIQRHEADKAGLHFDLRLAMRGVAFSWAIPQRWPTQSGVRKLAIRQSDHTLQYMNWSGIIEDGYGKGKVTVFRRGDCEILESGPRKIRFALYDSDPEEYVLIKTGQNWILMRPRIEGPSTKKPRFKTLKKEEIPKAPQMFDALSAKLDGAHAAVVFGKPGSQIRVFSPRVSKRTGRPLEYTHKIPGILGTTTPPGLANSIVRGEVLAVKGRKSMGHTSTARVLNTRNPLEAREKQKEHGRLQIFPFGVDVYRGKDVRDEPPEERLKRLKEVSKITGWKTPEIAITPGEKRRLYKRVESGKHPLTDEGFVGFNLQQRDTPVKVKFRPDTDVVVRRIFPGKRGGYAGGFEYSPTYTSPIIGRVGTGFDHATLKDMHKNPRKYLGRKATVEYQRGGKTALRAPSFKRWHLDY